MRAAHPCVITAAEITMGSPTSIAVELRTIFSLPLVPTLKPETQTPPPPSRILAAAQLIASGLDILTISRRLGHGSPTITLGVYGHLFANTDERAAAIMEKIFGEKPPTTKG